MIKNMINKPATIKDIAAQAEVSISAVSRVLNGNMLNVRKDKRERILQVAAELNYKPNLVARSMVTGQTKKIGMVVTDLSTSSNQSIIGVESILKKEGYQILLTTAVDLEQEIAAVEVLRTQQVDGLIFMLVSKRYPDDHFRQLKEYNLPFIVINRYIADNDISQVLMDDFGGGYTATQHLIGLGHRRIGIISGPLGGTYPWYSSIARFRGWQQTLLENNLAQSPDLIFESDYTIEGAYQAAQRFLKLEPEDRPTALFVANFAMAAATIRALHDGGLRVPQDVAIVAGDDSIEAAYHIPSITTLSLPIIEAGRQAAITLMDWIKAGELAYPQNVTLKFKLTVRESSGQLLNAQS